MKILFDLGHPAHVHYFRNMIRELEKKGHIIGITARDKDITRQLLDAYGLKYSITDKNRKGLLGKLYGLVKNDVAIIRKSLEFKPDLFVSFGSPYAAHSSRVLGKKHIVFTDTETAKLVIWLTFPFTDVIATPDCYTLKLNPKKHVKFAGFFEMAYLHPNWFRPDPKALEGLGLGKGEKSFVVRFVSWESHHDIGQGGMTLENKKRLVNMLSHHGRVYITSEGRLPLEFDKYRLPLPPEKIHHLLAFATLYFGESPTMTTESSLLGTPAVCINSWACDCGNFHELRKYGMIGCFHPEEFEDAIEYTNELISRPDLKEEWLKRRDNLLRDKVDVTRWMVDLIENTANLISTP